MRIHLRNSVPLTLLLTLYISVNCYGESSTISRELLNSADEILEVVAELRQLEVKRPVEKGVKSRSEIESFLIERIKTDYPEEEIAREERLLKRLGLIPNDLHLYGFMLELLTEQLAGYYDPYTETFFLADWIPLEIQKPVMAHELTHALQDQHFDLEKYLDRIESNDDRSLARSALIEGEGLLIMLDYVLQPSGKSSLDIPDIVAANQSQMSLMDAEFHVFAGAPSYLRETLLFPYTYGANFLQEIIQKHSWSKVDGIYEDLPSSTEQILHPSKYLEERDEPTEVDTIELRSFLSGTWETVSENVLGEFTMYLLLQEFLDDRLALETSRGWDGDSIALLENAQGQEALLLATAWDSARDAEEFQTAYVSLIQKRFPSLQLGTSRIQIPANESGIVITWEDAERVITFISHGTQVDIVERQK